MRHTIPPELALLLNDVWRAAYLFAPGPVLVHSNKPGRHRDLKRKLLRPAFAAAQTWWRVRNQLVAGVQEPPLLPPISASLFTLEIGTTLPERTYLLVVERGVSAVRAPTTNALTADELFTEQDRRVALLISKGHTNLEIAAILGVSLSGVKRHIERMMDKTGLRRRTLLAIYILQEPGEEGAQLKLPRRGS